MSFWSHILQIAIVSYISNIPQIPQVYLKTTLVILEAQQYWSTYVAAVAGAMEIPEITISDFLELLLNMSLSWVVKQE